MSALRNAATIAVLVGVLLSCGVQAQSPARVYRVGVLGSQDGPTWVAFRESLRELGYVAGHNLALEERWSHLLEEKERQQSKHRQENEA
jgi:hypothetical protein